MLIGIDDTTFELLGPWIKKGKLSIFEKIMKLKKKLNIWKIKVICQGDYLFIC